MVSIGREKYSEREIIEEDVQSFTLREEPKFEDLISYKARKIMININYWYFRVGDSAQKRPRLVGNDSSNCDNTNGLL